MNLNDEERANVVRTLREAAEYMVERKPSGMCSAVGACCVNFSSDKHCHHALHWLWSDSEDGWRAYWYAPAFREHEARAFALDMLASIIEAGDSLE
jgi:hypothetical protein